LSAVSICLILRRSLKAVSKVLLYSKVDKITRSLVLRVSGWPFNACTILGRSFSSVMLWPRIF
jgi:hypothetical protein